MFGVVVLVLVLAVAVAAAAYWLFRGDAVRLAIERQASAWLAQPVSIGAADAQLFPRIGVRLQDVRVGEPARLILAAVQVSTDVRALLSRRVEDAEITVSDSRIEMPLPFEVPMAADATAGGAPASAADAPGLTVASVRTIALRNIRIVSRGREVAISADSSFAGSRLTISSFTASSKATSIDVNGVVDFEPVMDAQLRASAKSLDVDDLLALASAFAPEAAPRPRPAAGAQGRLVALVTAERASAAGIDARQFTTTVRVQGTRVSLSPTAFVLFGGRYQGDLDVDLRDATSVALSARITDLDVAQLAAFGGVPDTITGKLSGNGTFTGRGNDFSAMLSAARGDGNASITNGTIRRLNLVRTVVLFFGRPAPDAQPASDSFDRLDAKFSLARNVVTAEALSLHSPDVDIVAQGTLALDVKVLAGKADLSLSEGLSAQAGTDLLRYTREGNRVLLPATIGGTLDAPKLSIDASAALKRGLRNEVDQRLKGLLDRFRRTP